MAAAFGATLLALWTVAGGPVTNLPLYLVRSVGLAQGYTEAMAWEGPGLGWQYPAVVVVVILLAVLLWRSCPPETRLATCALTVFGGYFHFKHSFVRHDVGHSPDFFLVAAVVPLAVPWNHQTARTAVVVLTSCLALVLGFRGHKPLRLFFDPRHSVRAGISQVRHIVVPDDRQRMLTAARQAMATKLGVGPLPGPGVKGHRIHVDPHEASLAWLWRADWDPVPVFQTFVAYTPALDGLNARALTSAGRPERIVRLRASGAIDGRHPAWESPRYTLAMQCHYSLLADSPVGQVLAPSTGRCQRPKRLGAAMAAEGVPVPVPSAGPEDLIYARIHLRKPLRARIRELLHKPGGPTGLLVDRAFGYRLVTANAAGPLLLTLPGTADFSPTFGAMQAKELMLYRTYGQARIEFFSMRLGPAPAARR